MGAASLTGLLIAQQRSFVANIKSQKKRNITNAKRAERNKAVRSELKTRVKTAAGTPARRPCSTPWATAWWATSCRPACTWTRPTRGRWPG